MNTQDYSASFTVNSSPGQVFNSINNVSAWWTGDLEGSSEKLNAEFTVHFGEVHVSTQKIVAFVPGKKITWLVTASKLNFIKDQQEWNNTSLHFNIEQNGSHTEVNFTHAGLCPQMECFKDCSKGWDYYFKGSLYKLLTEGKGTPGL